MGPRATIRFEAAWLAVDPIDIRADADTALAWVVQVFGGAHPHHAYLFANRGRNRMKVLVPGLPWQGRNNAGIITVL